MVGEFSDVLRTVDKMKADRAIAEYAIGGAMAVAYWDEATYTEDLDIVILLSGDAHPLDPLNAVNEWLKSHDIEYRGEHAMIAGVPVQFMPAWNRLVEAAVTNAALLPYDGNDPSSVMMRVITPAYLVASWELDASANTARRRDRAARLFDAGTVTRPEVEALLEQYRNG